MCIIDMVHININSVCKYNVYEFGDNGMFASIPLLSLPSCCKDIRYVEILNGSEFRHDAIGVSALVSAHFMLSFNSVQTLRVSTMLHKIQNGLRVLCSFSSSCV